MKAAVYFSPDDIRYIDVDTPSINDDEILIKVKAVGVCGSDLLKIENQLVSDGTILGHEVSGDIIETGKNITNFKSGDRVVAAHHSPCFKCHYCLHESYSSCRTFKQTNIFPGGFAEYVKVPAYLVKNTLFKIPDNLSYEESIFMEPLACCIRAIKRAFALLNPSDMSFYARSNFLINTGMSKRFKGKYIDKTDSAKQKDTIVIIGLGVVGLLFVQLCNILDSDVIGFDIIKDRVNMAKHIGAKIAVKEDQHVLKESINTISDNKGADLIILAAGNASLLPLAISLVRDGGIILIFSSTKEESINIDFNALYFREISLISSYSPSPHELKEALELLKINKIIVKDLISSCLPLSDAKAGIKTAFNKRALKVIFR